MVITVAGESLIVIMVTVPLDNQSALLLEGVLHIHSTMTDRGQSCQHFQYLDKNFLRA